MYHFVFWQYSVILTNDKVLSETASTKLGLEIMLNSHIKGLKMTQFTRFLQVNFLSYEIYNKRFDKYRDWTRQEFSFSCI